MKRTALTGLFVLSLFAAPVHAAAQETDTIAACSGSEAAPPAPARLNAPTEADSATRHRWLFGIVGGLNILDTYLSPHEYTGGTHGNLHIVEKPVRWGGGHVRNFRQMATGFGFLKSPTDDGKELDFQLTYGYGYTYWRNVGTRWRLSAGGMAEVSGGFTYNTRNSNNPAQARLALDLAAIATAEYRFPLLRRVWTARLQMDAPLIGGMFSPNYGQSYYEIFSLGHYDHNVRFTSLHNAPTVRLLATVDVPVRKVTLTLGYYGEARQSHVNGLKRHAWTNTFVLGFVRHTKRVKNPR